VSAWYEDLELHQGNAKLRRTRSCCTCVGPLQQVITESVQGPGMRQQLRSWTDAKGTTVGMGVN
jgi:hypothetical protein